MFEAWKARRAERKRQRDARDAAARDERRRAELAANRGAIVDELSFAQQRLEAVRSFMGATGADVPDAVGLVLKSGESVYCVVTDAVLIEPRKGPGEWKGRSQGISMPIPGTRLRYRVGGTKGTFIAGEETPTPIDTGTFVATSTRGVFTGTKQSREWQWSKLLSVDHYEPGWMAMAVSNRQKISGIGVDSANRESFEFLLDLAIARATGSTDALEADCIDDIDQLTEALAAIDAPRGELPPSSVV